MAEIEETPVKRIRFKKTLLVIPNPSIMNDFCKLEWSIRDGYPRVTGFLSTRGDDNSKHYEQRV